MLRTVVRLVRLLPDDVLLDYVGGSPLQATIPRQSSFRRCCYASGFPLATRSVNRGCPRIYHPTPLSSHWHQRIHPLETAWQVLEPGQMVFDLVHAAQYLDCKSCLVRGYHRYHFCSKDSSVGQRGRSLAWSLVGRDMLGAVWYPHGIHSRVRSWSRAQCGRGHFS